MCIPEWLGPYLLFETFVSSRFRHDRKDRAGTSCICGTEGVSCPFDAANGVCLEHVLLSACRAPPSELCRLPLSLPVITDGGPPIVAGANHSLFFLLGMRIIPAHGVCGHTDKRIVRLRSALRVFMHRRRVSGRVVQLIAGHLSLLELLPREERCPFWTRCTNLLRSTGCHVEFRGTL